MATAMKTCRVCGKEYEACHTPKSIDCGFRWQDVACCEECGAKYLELILISRGLKPESVQAKNEDKENVKPIVNTTKNAKSIKNEKQDTSQFTERKDSDEK